ncbi:MAG: hypothetical protein JW810_00140 [Sedimentisphaerales bacterium]|nr:hypothetical protein [Sedimentisphaerales bacterium]
MNPSKRNITILGLLLCVAAVLLGQQISRRMQNKLDELDRSIASRRADLNQANREIQDHTRFVTQWNSIKGFLDEPVEERQRQFSAYLQKLEIDSGVLITSQSPFNARPMENNPRFQILSCTLNLSCDLKSLVDFLALLDQEDQWLLRIENLTVKARDRGAYAPGRFATDLPAPTDITVDMVVSIPAAAPTVEPAVSDKVS